MNILLLLEEKSFQSKHGGAFLLSTEMHKRQKNDNKIKKKLSSYVLLHHVDFYNLCMWRPYFNIFLM